MLLCILSFDLGFAVDSEAPGIGKAGMALKKDFAVTALAKAEALVSSNVIMLSVGAVEGLRDSETTGAGESFMFEVTSSKVERRSEV